MSLATLVYSLGDPMNEEKLITGSLRQIDNCTRLYADEVEMRNGSEFKYRIDSLLERTSVITNVYPTTEGRFILYFIEDNSRREKLDTLYNDQNPVITKLNNIYGDNSTTDVERARKLLFSSKGKRFLKQCLNEDWFRDTTGCLVKLKPFEAKELISSGYKPLFKDGDYYLSIEDILSYSTTKEKLGFMRDLVEDTLEIWKEKLEELDEDILYYYSRNLRMSINRYNKSMSDKKAVINFEPEVDTLASVIYRGGVLSHRRKGLYISPRSNKVLKKDAAA
jgi:hypothetical protein